MANIVFFIEMDMVEGFDGQHQVKFSPDASELVFRVMRGVKSFKPDYGSPSPFFSFGYTHYSSIGDAISVANQLAALPIDSYVFK